MRFPEAEADIFALAQSIIEAMKRRPEDFRSCEITVETLEGDAGRFKQSDYEAMHAEALSRLRHETKHDALATMVEDMTVVLRFAETAYQKEPQYLVGMGWGPRRPKRAQGSPGEVRDLAIVDEGETSITLKWKRPVDGGRVKAYEIQRSVDGGPWGGAGTAMKSPNRLDGQPRGVKLQYRVVAVNKVGRGGPSAVVTAVL